TNTKTAAKLRVIGAVVDCKHHKLFSKRHLGNLLPWYLRPPFWGRHTMLECYLCPRTSVTYLPGLYTLSPRGEGVLAREFNGINGSLRRNVGAGHARELIFTGMARSYKVHKKSKGMALRIKLGN
ncbi:MAG: hypothetical protein M0036_27000, partial [Desulfobacteraceae bacterium]|nr:hypothetical protein [Desulfobacteraceae bacterium]